MIDASSYPHRDTLERTDGRIPMLAPSFSLPPMLADFECAHGRIGSCGECRAPAAGDEPAPPAAGDDPLVSIDQDAAAVAAIRADARQAIGAEPISCRVCGEPAPTARGRYARLCDTHRAEKVEHDRQEREQGSTPAEPPPPASGPQEPAPPPSDGLAVLVIDASGVRPGTLNADDSVTVAPWVEWALTTLGSCGRDD